MKTLREFLAKEIEPTTPPRELPVDLYISEGDRIYCKPLNSLVYNYLERYFHPSSTLQFVFIARLLGIYCCAAPTIYVRIPIIKRLELIPPYIYVTVTGGRHGDDYVGAVIGIDDVGNFFCHWLPEDVGSYLDKVETEQDIRRLMGFHYHIYEVEKLEEGKWYRTQGDLRMTIIKIPMQEIYNAIQTYKLTEKMMTKFYSLTLEQLDEIRKHLPEEETLQNIKKSLQMLFEADEETRRLIDTMTYLMEKGEKINIREPHNSFYLNYYKHFRVYFLPRYSNLYDAYDSILFHARELLLFIEHAISKSYFTPDYDEHFQDLLSLLYSYNTQITGRVGNHRIIIKNGIYLENLDMHENIAMMIEAYAGTPQFFTPLYYRCSACMVPFIRERQSYPSLLRWIQEMTLFLILEPATIDFKHPEHRDVTIELDKSPDEAILVVLSTLRVHQEAIRLRESVERMLGRQREAPAGRVRRVRVGPRDITDQLYPSHVIGKTCGVNSKGMWLKTLSINALLGTYYPPSKFQTKLIELMSEIRPIPFRIFVNIVAGEDSPLKEGLNTNRLIAEYEIEFIDRTRLYLLIYGDLKVFKPEAIHYPYYARILRISKVILSSKRSFSS